MDGEPEDREWPPAENDDRSHCPVDERRAHLRAREGPGPSPTGDRPRATEHPDRAPAAEVLAKDDVRVEDRDEPVEVAVACGPEERIDDLALTIEVGIGSRHLGALDATPCPAGELSRRLLGS